MALDQKKFLDNISKYLKDENFLKKVFIGAGIAAIIILLSIFLLKSFNEENFGVLYAKLNAEDAGDILEVLQKDKIPYKIEGDGSIILVPKDKIYDVRLKLAAQGIPSSKTVGFEIFNEPKMGATHFQENVNYLRAIEGELARTIQKIDAVENAKINIALPQESIFAREEEEAKASVIVKLGAGRDLTSEQVKAIVFLVSHAVPKLKAENVTVVDNRGRVLSDILSDNSDKSVLNSVDIKKRVERNIEKRIESMLAKALGPQKVVVRVSAEIESAKIRQKDELYDPDRVAVVSERQIKDSQKGYSKKQTGAPGTPTNVPAVINTNQNNLLLDKNKKDTTTDYDVSKSIVDTQKELFKIKRLSIGVLLDGKYEIKKDANGSETKVFVPRSKKELASYEELIKSATGFDPKRGDKISVVSVPFEAQAGFQIEKENKKNQNMIILIAAGALVAVLLILLMIFMMKAKKAKEKQKALEEAKLQESFQKMEEMKKEEESIIDFKSDPAYQKILQMVDENPEVVASLVSKWIKEEGK